jgi:transposase-like protein/IS1 family transposase
MQTITEQMNASQVFCPNLDCQARGIVGQGNIVIHGRQRPRYRCKTCGKTFSAKEGTLFAGLRKPTELIVTVVTLLAYGCPVQAIVHAFGLDERTVAAWRDRAGAHCQRVHEAIIEQASLDLVHVQADEIRVKGRAIVVWMGLAMMVSTRLWLAGVVSQTRDRHLADRLLMHVRACADAVRALLVATDGWTAYPNSIKRAFREKIKETAGRGRACLRVWPELCIATVIKRTQKMRVVEVTRKMTHGVLEQAEALLKQSQGGSMLNTAFIERLNGTMRERLATLTRKCRHAARRLRAVETGMYLIGCTYNFCFPHHELSKAKHRGHPCTPAMAAGLTDHVWSIFELLCYRVAPSPWVPPKLPGRPRKHPVADPALPKRPRGRPRTKPLPDPSQPKRPRGRPRKLALVPSTS